MGGALSAMRVANADRSTTLDLRGGGLTKLPRSMFRLQLVSEILLGWNNFTTLDDDDFSALSLLSVLYLNDNRLVRFPISVFTVRMLRELYLNNNALTSVPEEVTLLAHLCVLAVSGNRIRALPSLQGLERLRELFCGGNEIDRVPETIGHCVQLQLLDFQSNSLTQLPFRALLRLAHLRELHIAGNPLHADVVAASQPGLSALKSFMRRAARSRHAHAGDCSTDMWLFKKISALMSRAADAASVRPQRSGSLSSACTVSSDENDSLQSHTTVGAASPGRAQTLGDVRSAVRRDASGRSLGPSSPGDSASQRARDSASQLETVDEMRVLMDNAMREHERLTACLETEIAAAAAAADAHGAEEAALLAALDGANARVVALQRGLRILTSGLDLAAVDESLAAVTGAHGRTPSPPPACESSDSAGASTGARAASLVRFASRPDVRLV